MWWHRAGMWWHSLSQELAEPGSGQAALALWLQGGAAFPKLLCTHSALNECFLPKHAEVLEAQAAAAVVIEEGGWKREQPG